MSKAIKLMDGKERKPVRRNVGRFKLSDAERERREQRLREMEMTVSCARCGKKQPKRYRSARAGMDWFRDHTCVAK